MKRTTLAVTLGALALAGCAVQPDDTFYGKDMPYGEEVTRTAPAEATLLSAEASQTVASAYEVVDVAVNVSDRLTVSEENTFKPASDIVWREDPLGDRRAQVGALIGAAVREGVANIEGARPVKLVLDLVRFHALTELTRATAPSGSATHDIMLMLTIVDANSGRVIESAHPVGFEIEAHTGFAALADRSRGITQRQRISEALMQMIRTELVLASQET